MVKIVEKCTFFVAPLHSGAFFYMVYLYYKIAMEVFVAWMQYQSKQPHIKKRKEGKACGHGLRRQA